MRKASIHIKPVKYGSERHNQRRSSMEHVYEDLTASNESWVSDSIHERLVKIRFFCKQRSGRHLRSDATPIREAVVNLESHHTIRDVKKLTKVLHSKYKINAFQIYVHRDEGVSKENLNYHAHILFDWQNKASGKILRLDRKAMIEMQDLTANTLDMERGLEGSKSIRLSAQAFKASMEVESATMQVESTEADLRRNKAALRKLKRRIEEERDYEDNLKQNVKIVLSAYNGLVDKYRNLAERIKGLEPIQKMQVVYRKKQDRDDDLVR